MATRLTEYVQDSNGHAIPNVEFAANVVGPFGERVVFSHTMDNIETPYGKRLITTVNLFPCDDRKEVFSGAAIQAPTDEHNYDYAMEVALFKAAQSYFATKCMGKFYKEFRHFDYDPDRVDKFLRKWAHRLARQMRYDGMAPSQQAYFKKAADVLASKIEDAIELDTETRDALMDLATRLAGKKK